MTAIFKYFSRIGPVFLFLALFLQFLLFTYSSSQSAYSRDLGPEQLAKREEKQTKLKAQVDAQLEQLVKYQRSKNGWLGDGTVPPFTKVIKNLPYLENPISESQKLDIYLPQKADLDTTSEIRPEPLPVVVWVHGGGWQAGDKRGGPFRPLIEAGFAVVSINYRLSGEAKWPAQLDDCRTALTWLHEHSQEFGMDPSRIALWGASAGGQLVLMLGLAAPDKPTGLAAICDWFGPTDLFTYLQSPDSAPNGVEMITRLLGHRGNSLLSSALAASPINYCDKPAPCPILIMHGHSDPLVPIDQSRNLAKKLKAAGDTKAILIQLPGGHGYPGFGKYAIEDVIKFLKKNLRTAGD